MNNLEIFNNRLADYVLTLQRQLLDKSISAELVGINVYIYSDLNTRLCTILTFNPNGQLYFDSYRKRIVYKCEYPAFNFA